MKAPFWVIGHRGSPVSAIENTLESFALAIEQGANALELDIGITSDRRAIVWHDWDPNSFKAILRASGIEPDVRCRPFAPWGRFRRRVSELMPAQ